MINLREVINEAKQKEVAIGHFNISDLTALKAITRAARELSARGGSAFGGNVPVIIGTSEGEAEFIGFRQAAALVKSIREESGQPVFLNGDHLRSLESVKKAVEAGYDSIIFDAAREPFEENIKKTKEVVNYVKSINPNILVEGELGYIGTSSKVLDSLPEGAAITEEQLTKPEEAKQFIEETGVDLLAPAVGNIHGMLKDAKNPNLNIPRIKAIKDSVNVPLVLHGGSGISDDDFREAVRAGISVIHINTEIRVAWREGMESAFSKDPNEVAPYKLLLASEEKIYKIVLERLKLFSGLA